MYDVPLEDAVRGGGGRLTAAQRFGGTLRDVGSGCSSIIFRMRQDGTMWTGGSTLKERREEELLIYGSSPPLIHHAVPVHAAVIPRQGAAPPLVQPASHSHVRVTSRVLHSDPPPTPPHRPALLSHSYNPETHHDRITYSTREALKYGRARYERTNSSRHSPSHTFWKSLSTNRMLHSSDRLF